MATALLRYPSEGQSGPALAVMRTIEQFLATAREPALLEPGEDLLPLVKDSWSCELRSSHVLLQAWDERRNWNRRVIAAREETRGKLALTVQLFGGRAGTMHLLDLGSPRTAEWKKRGTKLVFRQRFRQFLSRQFPDWRTAELSTEPDLQHSLSPAYPRALLIRGNRALAAIAVGPQTADAAQVLTFGLIWLDYLRSREDKRSVDGLVLLLPAGSEKAVAQRLMFLDSRRARYELFTYDEHDFAQRVDPADAGNVESAVQPCRQAPSPGSIGPLLDEVAGYERVERPDGTASLRIHGVEFASIPTRKTPSELLAHARELSRLRRDRGGALYKQNPERGWNRRCGVIWKRWMPRSIAHRCTARFRRLPQASAGLPICWRVTGPAGSPCWS